MEIKPILNDKVRILGKYSPSMIINDKQQHINLLIPNRMYIIPSRNAYVHPIRIIVVGDTIAMIDKQQNLWIVNQDLKKMINFSKLINKKIKSVALNEHEVIAQTKKGYILFSWGITKVLTNQYLEEIHINQNVQSDKIFIKAYNIKNISPNHSHFYFSIFQNPQYSNRLYLINHLNQSCTQVIGYPNITKFQVPFKVVGISIGKFHGLCWDDNGELYSWGAKSYALGYQELPIEEYISNPQRVNILDFNIVSAFASNLYSLALTSQGILLEWGIKKQINQNKDQIIKYPRPLINKLNIKDTPQKYICLKGKDQLFAAISVIGQFYIWGRGAKKFLSITNDKLVNSQNTRLQYPTLVSQLQNKKIIDFAIQQSYIAVILSEGGCNIMMAEEKIYWENKLQTIKSKLTLTKRQNNKTQSCENDRNKGLFQQKSLYFNKKLDNPRVCLSMDRYNLNKSSKQDKIYNYLMDSYQKSTNIKKNKMRNTLSQEKVHQKSINYHLLTLISQRNQNANEKSSKQVEAQMKMIAVKHDLKDTKNFIVKTTIQKQQKQIQRSKLRPITTNQSSSQIKRKVIKPYNLRLNQVKQKKKSLQVIAFQNNLKRIQQTSLQYRQHKKQQQIKIKQQQINKKILKELIQNNLIKCILLKILCQPLGEARKIKIQNFARNLKLERKEKLIRKIFLINKVKRSLAQLRKMNPKSFLKLCAAFKMYLTRRRKRQLMNAQKLIVKQIYKHVIQQKIKLGLLRIHLNVRKLQKFNEWVLMVKKQRIKCLKTLWKNNLFNIMKIKSDTQTSISYYIPKFSQQLTFKSLYQERIFQNPLLKLENFLNKKAIFSVKFQFFLKIIDLFSQKSTKIYKSERIINNIKLKRSKIKFFDQQKQRSDSGVNLFLTDVLPYSLHFNILQKPPNFDINVPQGFKNSQKWINQQKYILEKCLQSVIQQHNRDYKTKKRNYDLQLAYFIKSRYQKLSEKRWRSIIEYNQLKKTYSKLKKQKQLKRLLCLVGFQSILQQDCLPQKSLVLDCALMRPDAPKPPNSYIVFGSIQFKKLFKKYVQIIQSRLRYFRKITN